MMFVLPRYCNQRYTASLHKSFDDNYDGVFRVDRSSFAKRCCNEL
jgi:hypothetical protein